MKNDLPVKNGAKQVSTSDKHLLGSEVTCEVNDQVSVPTCSGRDEATGQSTAETLTTNNSSQETCSNDDIKTDKECGKTLIQVSRSGSQIVTGRDRFEVR